MTADDYLAVNFRLWLRRPRTRFNHWLLGAALLLLAISLGAEVAQTGQIGNRNTLIFLAIGIVYGLARRQLVRYQLRRAYAQNPAAQGPIDFELNANGLRGNGPAGRFESRWPQIQRAVRVSHWLLLYPTDTACYYLDLRRLQAPATVQDVAALLQNAGVVVQEV